MITTTQVGLCFSERPLKNSKIPMISPLTSIPPLLRAATMLDTHVDYRGFRRTYPVLRKKQMRCMCCKVFGRNIRTCKSRTQTSSSHKRPLKVRGLWCRVASRRRCGARGRWQMETCVRRARDTTHGDHVRLKIKGMKVDANFIYISS